MFKLLRKLFHIFIVAILGFGCAFIFNNQIINLRNKILGVQNGLEETENDTALYSQLNYICEMSSLEYGYTNSYIYTDTKTINDWKIPFTQSKVVFVYEGAMKLGINTSGMEVHSEKEQGKISKISIILPKIEILSNSIDTSTIEVLKDSSSIFNKLDQKDNDKINNDLKNQIEKDVTDSSLLETAKQNLEDEITNFFVSIYGSDLVVEYI